MGGLAILLGVLWQRRTFGRQVMPRTGFKDVPKSLFDTHSALRILHEVESIYFHTRGTYFKVLVKRLVGRSNACITLPI